MRFIGVKVEQETSAPPPKKKSWTRPCTSYFPLPTSDFQLPTSHFQLPTSNFPLPTSHLTPLSGSIAARSATWVLMLRHGSTPFSRILHNIYIFSYCNKNAFHFEIWKMLDSPCLISPTILMK